MNNAFGQFNDEALSSFKEKAMDFYNFKPGGCPKGFRSRGFKTIAGERRKVCCSPDGKICMTADGIPL